MSADKYKGESPAKKMVRLNSWLKTSKELGKKFYTEKHLVLASREGGDISVLLGLGVDPSNIIAVDLVKFAVDSAKEKFPGVVVYHNNITEVAKKYANQFASINLDWCGHASKELLSTTLDVLRFGAQPNAICYLAFLSGREKPKLYAKIQEEKTWFDNVIDGCPHKKQALNKKDRQKFTNVNSRLILVAFALKDLGLNKGVWVDPDAFFYYCSKTSKKNGLPFAVLHGKVRFNRLWSPKIIDTYFVESSETDVRKRAIQMHAEMKASESPRLRKHAAHFAAKLLNIPKSRVVSWASHYSRGTYGDLGLRAGGGIG